MGTCFIVEIKTVDIALQKIFKNRLYIYLILFIMYDTSKVYDVKKKNKLKK